jgi:hypothetical protein
MDADLQALQAFRDAVQPSMPVYMRWAMAGALALGAFLGGVAGLVTGWVARGTR